MAKVKKNEIEKQVDIFITEILSDLNEYSCVLIGVSLVDEHLKMLLEKYFITGSTADRILDNGFAANLRTRADLAYVLGLINKTDYQNLINILEIRNKFGHNFQILKFSSEEISKLCDKLVVDTEKGEDEDGEAWNGYKYRYALIDLISGISYQTDIIKKSEFKEVQDDYIPDEVLDQYKINQ